MSDASLPLLSVTLGTGTLGNYRAPFLPLNDLFLSQPAGAKGGEERLRALFAPQVVGIVIPEPLCQLGLEAFSSICLHTCGGRGLAPCQPGQLSWKESLGSRRV